MNRSLTDTDGDKIGTKTSMPCCFSITILSGLLFIHEQMVISTIANIANHALVSTYISQVTGNHPTSTGLSIAKHTHLILDLHRVQGMFLDKVVLCIK